MSRPASNGITGSLGKPSGIKKRKADDELRSEQRLAKRFDLLNLEQNGKLHLPVQHPPPPARRPPAHTTNGTNNNNNNDNDNSDSMALDDTKDKIYIHNLDDELADMESEEEKLVFLPDIEKKLGKIPKSVLLGEGYPGTGNEMVLYSVPSSLSVPEEQDKVRKAIIESRARARERQLRGAVAEAEAEAAPVRHGDGGGEEGKLKGESGVDAAADQVAGVEEDEDAMDLG